VQGNHRDKPQGPAATRPHIEPGRLPRDQDDDDDMAGGGDDTDKPKGNTAHPKKDTHTGSIHAKDTDTGSMKPKDTTTGSVKNATGTGKTGTGSDKS
jgi:hypothetical protein